MINRPYNSDRNGRSFGSTTIAAVWCKGNPAAGFDPSRFRKDAFGNLIEYSQYGNTNSPFGWEIDHIVAVANGGNDDLSNLRPLYWLHNRQKGDGPSYWRPAA